MAVATSTKRSWGYILNGGTSATTVFTNKQKLKTIKFSTTNATDTLTVTDLLGNALLTEIGTLATHTYDHPFYGAYVDGLIITLSATTASVFIFIE